MSDAEAKQLSQIHTKSTYALPSGLRIQFVHDHVEKTFDAWEINEQGQKRLLETQPTIIEPFEEFQKRILAEQRSI